MSPRIAKTGSRPRLIQLLLPICLSWLTGCGINDKDLQVAATAYYAPKASPSQIYKLLSTPSKQQLTEAEVVEAFKHPSPVEYQVTVLGEETQGNTTYGKVMLTSTVPGGGCKMRLTRTWIKDDGRWRALNFPKLREKAGKQYDSGDYAASLQTTEEWLKLDPFSVEGLDRYIFAQQRSGSLAARDTRSQSDVIRSMLAINQADDTVLFNAATHSDAVGVAKGFFNKIPLDSCVRENAAFNVLHKLSTPKDKLAFLDETKLASPSLSAARIEILDELGRGQDAIRLLKDQGGAIGEHFKKHGDPAWSAGWAVRMGIVAVHNGDDTEARKWLEIAAALDPQDKSLARLDRRLNDPCCNQLAARLTINKIAAAPYGNTYVFAKLENLSPVPFKEFRAKAQLLSKEGFVLKEDTEFGRTLVAPHQVVDIRFTFFTVPWATVADGKVELTSVSVEGLDRADGDFWVRKVGPEGSDAKAQNP